MFTLDIPITTSTLDILKAALTRALPDVKSSHRVEALGRGFGFRTYAAMRAATNNGETIRRVDGATFAAYLKEHDFVVRPSVLYQTAATVAIDQVLGKHPRLTSMGIGVGRWKINENGKPETARENYARLIESQNQLRQRGGISEFLRALPFLQRTESTKTIRPGANSYRLKHIAENFRSAFPEGEQLGPHYVSNGALIAAAIHCGFQYKEYLDNSGNSSLNADFNMSKRCLLKLDREIRPDVRSHW